MTQSPQSPFYIRLVGGQLSKAEAMEWATIVKANLPNGVQGSIQVQNPDGQLTSVYMIHRTLKSGVHIYEIPLTRDLIENEALLIAEAWDSLHPGDDHDIETSTEEIEAARQGPTDAVVMGQDDYNQMCETLARHQHSRWCDERNNAGWRYGLTLSSKDRTHPLIRPWEQLPEQYRKVDYEIPKQFMDMLAEHGYVVVKRTDLQKWLKK